MRARKSYGQHFLVQPGAAEQIANYIHDYPEVDFVVEIGPGRGALTQYLVDIPKPLLAIEADRDLVPILENDFGHHTNLKIMHADFLKHNIRDDHPDESFALIGNFPYNISSQIIFSLIEYRNQCPVLIGMFQKELADRLIAPPGSKTYGAISAMLQLFYTGERKFNLEPEAFNPQPRVRSTVIALHRREDTPEVDFKVYRHVVKMAFGQRRKKMRNTIGHLYSEDIAKTNPYFDERPEQLGVDDFVNLVELLDA